MTREEAMDLLDNLIGMVEDSQDNDYDEALKMGIKALERTSNAFPTHECVDPTHECVEMINREAALDAISTFGNREYRRKQGTLRDAYKLISALPYEHVGNSEQLEWIPCSERLPEKEGWYITTVESEKTGRRRIENDLFAVDIALAHGHTPNKFCKDGYRQRTVAWMPFPKPYREVE